MESSIAESLWRQPACELLPTNLQKEEELAGCGAEQKVLERSGSQVNLCAEGPGGGSAKNVVVFSIAKVSAANPAATTITAFTSRRTNLSPFTKGCRERDASM